MKMKMIMLSKELTVNLGNFSNVKPGIGITWELGEGEEPDFERMWDLINREIGSQTDIEPGWIKKTETKNYYKTTLKYPKKVGEENG